MIDRLSRGLKSRGEDGEESGVGELMIQFRCSGVQEIDERSVLPCKHQYLVSGERRIWIYCRTNRQQQKTLHQVDCFRGDDFAGRASSLDLCNPLYGRLNMGRASRLRVNF